MPLPGWDEIETLLRAPSREALPRIRALTRRAIAAVRADADLGCGDELHALCFLLYLVGDAEDVLLIHRARRLNMDTGATIERDLLTMRRDRATMMGVAEAAPEQRRRRLAREIGAAFDAPDHASPEELEEGLRTYFGVLDARLHAQNNPMLKWKAPKSSHARRLRLMP